MGHWCSLKSGSWGKSPLTNNVPGCCSRSAPLLHIPFWAGVTQTLTSWHHGRHTNCSHFFLQRADFVSCASIVLANSDPICYCTGLCSSFSFPLIRMCVCESELDQRNRTSRKDIDIDRNRHVYILRGLLQGIDLCIVGAD